MPHHGQRLWLHPLALSAVWSLLACGDAPPDPSIAEAVKTESPSEKAAAELEAKQRAAREAEKAKVRQLEAERQAEIDAVAVLPDPMPENLGQACDAVVEAYDAFMKAGGEQEVLEWHDGRRKDLGERRAKCIKLGSVEVAACGAAALGRPLPSLADLPREEAARKVLESCADKFETTGGP